jgi:lipopolysaccharide export system protein LptA
MSAPIGRMGAIVFIAGLLIGAPALAATKPSSSPLLPGGNSKEPISIAADKLNYFDKEQKAIYTGNVVAIQGDSKLTCSVMTIFMAKADPQAAGAPANAAPASPAPPAAAPAAGPGASGSQVKHMDALGPVTITSKTQVATGDRASYDKEQNKVWLFDNVTLSDSGNVTKGDKLTYDLTTGEAVVEIGKTSSRVTGQFIQGSGADTTDKSATPKKPVAANASDKPKPAPKKAPANDASLKP